MTQQGERLAKAALELVGVPFRLHGRDPAYGLDCVGLVSTCLAQIGRPVRAPSGYGLRNTRIDRWFGYAERAGLHEAGGPIAPGDILLVRPAAAQHHLMIAETAVNAIHAHAGLRRVVRQRLADNLETVLAWRLRD